MPFSGGLQSSSNGALVFSIGLALLYLFMIDRPPNLRQTAAKALAVAMLSLLAFFEGGSPLLIAALALSALGEAVLAQNDSRAVPLGFVIFAVAHIACAALFAGAGGGIGIMVEEPLRLLAIVAVAAIGVALARRNALPNAPRMPFVLHGLALGLMATAALTVQGYWIAVAGLSLLLGHGLLAVWRLSGEKQGLRPVAWILRYAAQLVFVLAGLLPTVS